MVEYPITIQNSIVVLNYDELPNLTVVKTYVTAGDLPNATGGQGAGTLVGINIYYGNYLSANVTEEYDPDVNESVYNTSMIADLFSDQEASSYDNYTFNRCGLIWSSPTDYVLNAMHDFMFRAALQANNGSVQSFTAQRMIPALLFHSDYYYLAAALVAMLLALLVVLSLLWGWWELERPVSLSPLEMAKAFDAPIMRHAGQNSTVEGILKKVGEIGVKYNDGLIVFDDNGHTQQESSVLLQDAEQGHEEEV